MQFVLQNNKGGHIVPNTADKYVNSSSNVYSNPNDFLYTVCQVCLHHGSHPSDPVRIEKKMIRSQLQPQWDWESLCVNETDKQKRFFFSPLELAAAAAAARSGESDQPLCLSVLSGKICGVTWTNRASQLSGKIITQSRTFLDNFGSNRPPGMWHSSWCD